jgi:hypothetical protein
LRGNARQRHQVLHTDPDDRLVDPDHNAADETAEQAHPNPFLQFGIAG